MLMSRWIIWGWGFLRCIVLCSIGQHPGVGSVAVSVTLWLMLALDKCMCTQFWLALKQHRRHTAFDNPSNPLKLHVSDKAAVKSLRKFEWDFLLHLSLCSLQFGSSSVYSHCVLSVSKVQTFANVIWRRCLVTEPVCTRRNCWLSVVQAPPFHNSWNTPQNKVQLHPFDFQKSQRLSIKQYIYFTTERFSKDQQAFTVISIDI